MNDIVISTTLTVEYKIKNSINLFSTENTDLLHSISNRAVVVIDETVNELYSDKILTYFQYHNINIHLVIIKGIETEKNLENLLNILSEMEQFGVDRKNEPIIGIGGGVILDLVGLAATLYRRGVPYIKIPTTLLGIVDVSVAAKTGINFLNRRNRLGSYYAPVICFLDKSFIKTVEPVEISSGMGEILKIAVIKDRELFELLEKHAKMLYDNKFDTNVADSVIMKSIVDMAEELEPNLWEKDLKRCVDYGHSFSPIIEMRSLVDEKVVSLTHGQAVTLDVIFSAILSHVRGYLLESDIIRIINVAKQCGLFTYHESFTNPLLLLESLTDTMKHRNGNQNLPIPTSIGEYTFLNDVTYGQICDVVELYKKMIY